MASRVLSLRVDEELWERIRAHAARRGISPQDYVLRALVRDDFDQRFMASVEETDRFYAAAGAHDAPPPAHGAEP
ncbi:ribbon-helix-helix protein, CopG family [Actinacidiphila yeochonensis]|uniref:ribbon-helix-helix protein, CopG family n=1 Tax=Actinacidiphila yeochonensis TaxID=89050 RepID=UPI00099D4EFD|nr:ribbon-helix-helix protein, CopG family [Actinacidiphila yeochonensis]